MTLHALTSDGLDQATGPVLVLLHGYGSDERDLAGLVPHLPSLPWASVRAPLRHPAFGHAWYHLDQLDVLAPAEHAIGQATDALWAWVDANLAPEALILPVGFSQGGCMATQLLRTRPERCLGAVILSGYVQASPQTADATLAERRPQVFWGRGDADPVIPARAVSDTQAWIESHATGEVHLYPRMGHSVSDAELDHLYRWVTRLIAAVAPRDA